MSRSKQTETVGSEQPVGIGENLEAGVGTKHQQLDRASEQQQIEAPLDPLDQSILDILDEERRSKPWVQSARHFPTGVPCVGRSMIRRLSGERGESGMNIII